ncbi:type I restriction-modification system subunit M [Mycoplasma seminis]|uniref:site-specific DNA-methyltransferase (adenine-specific) n=1 Tax=Mycoplasma seminis TaxID=512749 RepID=A0ABY9HAS2_9MOLU|nr:type I restriction-modification system subunit M [Mycoplasma seminis]WLP85700.1 type I restriction-modification system subunit M [Mycoplasma seminis]
MNKQELANRIWASANNMRSKIEANEYKDYILGFIFYKFLSEQVEKFWLEDGWGKEDLVELIDENYDVNIDVDSEEFKQLDTAIQDRIKNIKYAQKNLGYYISYKNLFSTWLKSGSEFDVSVVRDALASFDRRISPSHKKVFENIFNTLQTGLSKLGESTQAQTKAIRSLIELIKDIPMDDKQDYDVLGFIYEYLISMFAANAGKKAGEFYTPHEVSLLMSEIVSHHLKDRDTIQIYDPTSGSGSLLINIGKSIAKYMDKNKIQYYAQELKDNTYNLTRMNLVMRGIAPDNIKTRNGDTLKDDWPYFDDNNKENYEPLFVDAVVSNPPYSQAWDPENKESDARFAQYGVAPKSKADYAFLLHDLYHLKNDGILTIVLPHGVLFRGGEEERIRTNLIEHNNIDAIIGLPANIFFGTSIPTIVMVLKKSRPNTDVLIIDASKHFVKDGKNNKLQSSDIKRILDAYINREDIDKYCKKVSREQIRENEYNLNIPRYVDSNPAAESWDIYATMLGGTPNKEIDAFNDLWSTFPSLRNDLFTPSNENYSDFVSEEISDVVFNNTQVKNYIAKFKTSLDQLKHYLNEALINNMMQINIHQEEENIAAQINQILQEQKLLDYYKAYQLLDDDWKAISNDLEIIHSEGFASVKKVVPNMVLKKQKKSKITVEVQDGWLGYIIPFDLILKHKLTHISNQLQQIQDSLADIAASSEETFNEISEEFKETSSALFNEDISDIDDKEIKKAYKELLAIAKNELDSPEAKLIEIYELSKQKSKLNTKYKNINNEIQNKCIEVTQNLTEQQANELLAIKWINPLIASLESLPERMLQDFCEQLTKLKAKYEYRLVDIEQDIINTQNELIAMLDELEASDSDKLGLEEFKKLLSES